MGLNVRKNIQFTKLVKAPTQLKEFNFRKIPGTTEIFHVDVNDERGNRIVFNMTLEDGSWKISAPTPIPKWITEAEPKLHAAIEDELHP